MSDPKGRPIILTGCGDHGQFRNWRGQDVAKYSATCGRCNRGPERRTPELPGQKEAKRQKGGARVPTLRLIKVRRRRRVKGAPRSVAAPSRHLFDEVPTYWNGERLDSPAVRGWAVVADSTFFPRYWAREEGLIGQTIAAAEVRYGTSTFYLDNRDGSGWAKVTEGRGSPRAGHREVEVSSFVADFEVSS